MAMAVRCSSVLYELDRWRFETCWRPVAKVSALRRVVRPVHDETIAIHGGYTADSTRAVAVPIYQTVAHEFIDADMRGRSWTSRDRGSITTASTTRPWTYSNSGSRPWRAAPRRWP